VLAYLIRRMLAMIPTLLGITFITFLIVNLAPGDPVSTGFGQQPGGGPSADGGGDNQDRMADTIKAKKKLLGMVTENYAVGGWDLVGLPSGALEPGEWGEYPALPPAEQGGVLPGWPRAIAVGASAILAGTSEGAVVVLDPDTRRPTQVVEGEHSSPVQALALSAEGAHLVSGDGEGAIRLWSVEAGAVTLAASPDPLAKSVQDLAFLPDGGFLSASDDGVIRLHDGATGATRREYREHISGVYALAVVPDGQSFYSGGYDRTLRRWSLATGEVLQAHDAHSQSINDIAVAADGSALATACDDRKARVFSLEAGALGEAVVLEGHYKQVTAVAFSPGGSHLFTGSRDETVRVWDLTAGGQIAQTLDKTGRVHQLIAPVEGGLISAADSWRAVPVWKRYVRWLGRIATLDFDRSFKDDLPVIDKIAKALPVTLGLNVLTILIIYLISIPLGVFAAVRRGSTFDNVSSLLLFVLYSLPNFWVATLLIMFLSSKATPLEGVFGWLGRVDPVILPSVGLHIDEAQNLSYLSWLWDFIKHLVLPVAVMTYAGFASLSRYARTSMLETIQADFIRTARAKGLAESVVVWKHAFRNSLITIVTLLGNLLPRLIGGSVIVEYIFSINGMGKLGFDAILARDYPVIMAITTFSAFLTLLGILVSDILYSVVDPRVSYK